MTDLLDHMARLMAAQMQADIDAAIRGTFSPTGLGFYATGGTISNIANDCEPKQMLSSKALLAKMRDIEREFGPPPPPLKIQVSEHAMRDDGPARTYSKRKAKSVSHWRRMNKKWLKRYGVKRVPCMYKLDTSFMTRKPGITLLVHPTLAAKLYAALEQKALQP